MLNYVAALLLTYLIFDSESYWRDTSTPEAKVFPQGKFLPDEASWPVIHLGGSRSRSASCSAVGLAVFVRGALRAHALRVRGEGDRRLAARGRVRGHAHAAQDPRRDGAVGRAGRHRRREPGRRLPPPARPARADRGGLRLRRDRDRGARPLQPVRGRGRRVPARRAAERGLRAAGRRLPVRPRRRDGGADPLLRARRRAARALPAALRPLAAARPTAAASEAPA